MENRTKEKIYNFILRYIEEYGYAPSIRDICRGLGLKSTSSVHSYLKKLQEDGKIEMRGNLPRTIRVTDYIFTRKG